MVLRRGSFAVGRICGPVPCHAKTGFASQHLLFFFFFFRTVTCCESIKSNSRFFDTLLRDLLRRVTKGAPGTLYLDRRRRRLAECGDDIGCVRGKDFFTR